MSERASRLRDLIHRTEAAIFHAWTFAFRLVPLDAASAIGGAFGRLVGPLTPAHRTARRNLEIAFPDQTPAWRAAVLRNSWDNLGRTAAEFSHMDRISPESGRLEIVGLERLHALAAEGRPAVLVGGHFANWECLARAIVASGVPTQITYRAANNPYIDRAIIDSRRRYGVRLFAPKGGDGSREILEAMGRGESVGIMNDQKFNGGVPVPFFGVEAMTAPGPTRLALRFCGEFQPMSVQRLKGARFRVTVYPPIPLERTGDRAADIRHGVETITAFIEARVREKPEDWFWVHKRWPSGVYRDRGPPADER